MYILTSSDFYDNEYMTAKSGYAVKNENQSRSHGAPSKVDAAKTIGIGNHPRPESRTL